MIKNALGTVRKDLRKGTLELFESGLGFPVQPVMEVPNSARAVLKGLYREEPHAIMDQVFVAGIIAHEALERSGAVSAYMSAASSYEGLLIFAVDLKTAPSRSEVAVCTRAFNRASKAQPVAVLYRYNQGSRAALAVSERAAYKQEWRDGERIGRTAVLMDIQLAKPSAGHQVLLESVHCERFPHDSDIRSLCEYWLDRFCSADTDLLKEMLLEHWQESGTIVPFSRIRTVFGKHAPAVIKVHEKWGSYYAFLRDALADHREEVDRQVGYILLPDIRRFYKQFDMLPSWLALSVFNRCGDLLLLNARESEELLSDTISQVEEEQQGSLQSFDGLRNTYLDMLKSSESISADKVKAEESLLHDPYQNSFSLDDIDVSTQLLEDGEYDDLPLDSYTVAREDQFVIGFLENRDGSIGSANTGALRMIDHAEVLAIYGGGEGKWRKIEILKKYGLVEIVRRALYARVLDGLVDEENDRIELSLSNTPTRFLSSKSTDKTIIEYLQRADLLPNPCCIGDIRKLSLADVCATGKVLTDRVNMVADLKQSLHVIAENEALIAKMHGKCKKGELRYVGVRMSALSYDERLTATKLMQLSQNTVFSMDDLLAAPRELERDCYREKRKFSSLDESRLPAMLRLLVRRLEEVGEGWTAPDHPVFRSRLPMAVPLSELDTQLYEHLVKFLDSDCGVNEKVYLLARNGFLGDGDKWTLETIAQTQHVTRERVRQIEANAEQAFLWSMPVTCETVAGAIEGRSLAAVARELPLISQLLSGNRRSLTTFLALVSQEPGICLEVDCRILDDFFAETAPPIDHQQVVDYLVQLSEEDADDCELASQQADDLLYALEEEKVIEVSSEGQIIPRKLNRSKAAAHVLAGVPSGLPGPDVVAITNKLRYSDKLIDNKNDRVDSRYAGVDNELMYLCGKFGTQSIYAHINFLPSMPEETQDALMVSAKEFLYAQTGDAFHLSSFVETLDGKYDYYTIRHYMRALADDYDLRWKGQSSLDNIAASENTNQHVTADDRLYQIIKKSDHGLTSREMALQFARNSRGHISLILGELRQCGRVVQSSRRIFMTDNQFLKAVGKGIIKKLTDGFCELLDQAKREGKILDIDLVRQRMNTKHKLFYDKPFYKGLVDSLPVELGIIRRYSLVSGDDIPYNSITSAFDGLCGKLTDSERADRETCMQKVSEKIAASDTALYQAYYRWRHTSE